MSRFAAYKAEYVSAALNRALNDENTPVEEREKLARAVLRTFNRYQDAERSTATARARTAKQFEEFLQPDNVRLFPNLKWLPSRSADPRVSHTAFYNHIWAKDDPFWNTNAPGTEWNCKCDIEETDEPLTDNTAISQPAVPLGLEGNPAQTGEIFTDNASYIRAYNRSNTQRRRAEQKCENFTRAQLISELKTKLLNTKTKCQIEGTEQEVMFISLGIEEATQSMQNTPEYWLKNEILKNISNYLQKAQYVDKGVSDATHNTRPSTVRLKRNTDWFYYLKSILPDGTEVYLTIGHYIPTHQDPTKANRYYFYTITKQRPSY